MLLTQELALLGHHPTSGRAHRAPLDLGLAGAVLLELVLARKVDLVDARVRVLDPTPGGDPVLDAALVATLTERARRPAAWVDRRSRDVRHGVLHQLWWTGVIRHEESRTLGLWTAHRYPDRDHRPRAELLDRLGAVVLGGYPADERTVCLAGLVRAAQLRGTTFPGAPRRATDRRLADLAARRWPIEAVRSAVAAAQASAAAGTAAAAAGAAGAAASS